MGAATNIKAAARQRNKHAVRDDDRVHAVGSGFCSFETLCGSCDTGTDWAGTKEPLDCPGCLDVIDVVRARRNHP